MGYTPPQLDVRKVAGGWNAYAPSSTTADLLKIMANTTDAEPYITLDGAVDVKIDYASYCYFLTGGVFTMYITDSGTDSILATKTDNNLFLKPVGTGKVKFGVYDATPALASSGFIPILDAAGNERKLMVQA